MRTPAFFMPENNNEPTSHGSEGRGSSNARMVSVRTLNTPIGAFFINVQKTYTMSKQQDPATPRQEKKEGKQFYIDQVRTWDPADRECAELLDDIRKFDQMLFPTRADADSFVQMVRDKVIEVNRKYRRAEPLAVVTIDNYLSCYTAAGKDIFEFCIQEVKSVWEADANPFPSYYVADAPKWQGAESVDEYQRAHHAYIHKHTRDFLSFLFNIRAEDPGLPVSEKFVDIALTLADSVDNLQDEGTINIYEKGGQQ